ncbi:MAG: bifunctional phosphopantothenoylcysteine decarboxylase/phosphopantothenate--cysteine ligase CoaBC [Anaerolineales bacterium]|jgi:phosphopantothenoylcysteine decarboxylase/phosphopantothenate--cysteine ligase
MNPLQDKRILLGVTGSIACYKAADLASKLRQAGAEVDVILTEAGAKFVAPLTFQSVTGCKAYIDADLWGNEGHVLHIGLGKAADLLVIAPITANTMAKLAHGEAGNLLTLTALASECPLLIAPAMDGGMFNHAATQANLEILKDRGAIVLGPEAGHLASGMKSVGRMTEPLVLMDHIKTLLAQGGSMAGRKIVVTAGGTQEPLDPVRYLTNRSSGKQGYALARAARDMGAQVTLISAPTHLDTPVGMDCVDVRTAEEMLDAVLEQVTQADVLVMAAAVSDFKPAKMAKEKIKKTGSAPALDFESTPDILQEVVKAKKKTEYPRVTVGFAAESKDLLANAEKKLKDKGLDLIAANDISAQDAGFGVDSNRVTLLFANGKKEDLPLMSKDKAAAIIMERILDLIK